MQIEIINHGVMCSDYFQGCGLAFTDYDAVATGVGSSEREAFDDALDQLAQQEGMESVDWDEVERLAVKQYGKPRKKIVAKDEDSYLFLSVRIKL